MGGNRKGVDPVPQHLQPFLDALPVGEWVSREEMLKISGQSDYRRRIAQLRDEYGFDIDRSNINGQWHYRRTSAEPVRPRLVRRYPSAKQRRRIYARDRYVCQLCLVQVGDDPGKPSPTIDHKVPLIRYGADDDSNLQTTCTSCNIRKRRECATCRRESCSECPLAFPEKLPLQLVVHLPKKVMKALEARSKETGQPPELTALDILREWAESTHS